MSQNGQISGMLMNPILMWIREIKEIKEGLLKEGLNGKKKTFSLGHCPNEGGGLPMAEFFGPFSKSAFLVNKKSLFLQKCQCIDLLTVF